MKLVKQLLFVPFFISPILLTSCNSNIMTSAQFVLHRGLSSRHFENTAESFESAGKSSAFGIETDIYLTKNDTNGNHPLVCVHDVNPFRVESNKTRDAGYLLLGGGVSSLGYPNPNPNEYDPLWDPSTGTQITKLTLSEIQQKYLWTGCCGKNNDPSKGAIGEMIVFDDTKNNYGIGGDYKIPTFKEYLSICKKYNKEAFIEIKDENFFWGDNYAHTLVMELIKEINEIDYVNKCTIIAFDGGVFDTSMVTGKEQPFYNELNNAVTNADQHIAETASKLIKKFQKIIWADYKNQNPIQNAYYAIANNQNIDIDNKYLIEGKNSDLIKYAHSKHLLVNTWTVNNTTDLNKLLQFGVDQITGNVIF